MVIIVKANMIQRHNTYNMFEPVFAISLTKENALSLQTEIADKLRMYDIDIYEVTKRDREEYFDSTGHYGSDDDIRNF